MEKDKITIIGGGISGLYFSYNLLKQNPNRFIDIYEKSNYLGGRIKNN